MLQSPELPESGGLAPSPPPSSPSRLRSVACWLADRTAIVVVLVAAALFTGANLFRYPHYELDEGAYVGSASAMWERGELYYYTYAYDHPLLGWFLVGAWAMLVGGFDTFGMSINTGRVFMVLVTVASTLLVFLIVRRVTGRLVAGLFGAVVFAASPLGVILHRQVYVDNIGTMWLLASLYALAGRREHLGLVVLSAIAYGPAFWSKEVFVVFFPGMLYLAAARSHPEHRRFAVALWGLTAASAVSLFVLFAALKDELFPPGVLWSSSAPHVSLVGTWLWLASRDGGGFLDPEGDFRRSFALWRQLDPLLIVGGLVAAGIGLMLWRRDRFTFGVSLLLLPFALFLARGGVTYFYYVIPLLALEAVALGLVLGHAVNVAARARWVGRLAAPVVLALTIVLAQRAVDANEAAFTADETAPQRAAARWIADNLPSESVIVMDSYAWVDLRDPDFTGDRTFTAHYFWPALSDPTIRDEVFHDDWRSIDYLVISPSTYVETGEDALPLMPEAIANADEIRSFASSDYAWTMRVLRVRKPRQIEALADPLLTKTWDAYKTRFVEGGRVVEPEARRRTTAEGQALALFRAVYMDDRATFDALWAWTTANLRVRGDGLLAREWGDRPDGTAGVLDARSATASDQDVALALLFAARRWGEPAYQQAALGVLESIWERDTAEVGGRRLVVGGSLPAGEATGGAPMAVEPAAFAPYAYRVFAEADPSRPWLDLVESSYGLLARLQAAPIAGAAPGTLPDAVAFDPATGAPIPALGQPVGDGDGAFGLYWRLGLDWLWFKEPRAQAALQAFAAPLQRLETEGRLTQHPASETMADYAAVAPALLATGSPDVAHRVVNERILRRYADRPGFAAWGDDSYDEDDQTMAWLACAVMDGSLANLWAGETVIGW